MGDFNCEPSNPHLAKFVTVLDRHTPRKARIVRGNEKPHVNEDLRKEIMYRSKLRNIYQRTQVFRLACLSETEKFSMFSK